MAYGAQYEEAAANASTRICVLLPFFSSSRGHALPGSSYVRLATGAQTLPFCVIHGALSNSLP
jgi:hypothetical protein